MNVKSLRAEFGLQLGQQGLITVGDHQLADRPCEQFQDRGTNPPSSDDDGSPVAICGFNASEQS